MFTKLKSWGESGGFTDEGWPRLKAAIEFGEAYESSVSKADLVHPHDFEAFWPEEPKEKSTHFNTLAQYQAWRNILIFGLETFSGQLSRKSTEIEDDKDIWLRLRDKCKQLGFGPVHENNLMALRRFAIKYDTSPEDVSQNWAETVQSDLCQSERKMFRAGIFAFEKARRRVEIRGEFGLSKVPFERLERKPSPNQEYPLPPQVKADFEQWTNLLAAGEPIGFRGRRRDPMSDNTLRQYRFAFSWYWRCFASLFPDQPDPDTVLLAEPRIVRKIFKIADDSACLRLKPSMKKGYFGKIIPFLQRWEPQLTQLDISMEKIDEG